MHILVTGGAGFLGQLLIAQLLARGQIAGSAITQITSLDQAAGALADARLRYLTGDVADAAAIAQVFTPAVHAVWHLAAVVSGTAEADFDLGMRVNFDATRALLEACRAQHANGGPKVRMVFTSSVAVFGGTLPNPVTDQTPAFPQGSYGAQKLMGEVLLADHTRKGHVDGRSVRVPTVTVRPGKPNGAASSFASGMIREPLAGVDAVVPVPPETVLWVTSPQRAVAALLRAGELPQEQWGSPWPVNLPGLSVTVHEMAQALVRTDAAAARRLQWQLDPRIHAIVGTWPQSFATGRADALGFGANASFDEIVAEFIAHGAAMQTR